MNGKLKIDLGEVQKTLLIPLWARAKESERRNPLIRDAHACELVDQLDYDFESVIGRMPRVAVLNCVVRARHIDAMLLDILKEFPDAVIVNIGAGLDTTFQRIDNGRIFWYDLDLPDTMDLRKRLIPEGDRNRMIAKSVFDRSWFDEIKVRRTKMVFIAAGVLVYLQQEDIKALFLDLMREFPGSEIIFEIYSKLLLWLRRRAVEKREGRPDLVAPFRWGIGSAGRISKWKKGIEVLDEFPFYSRVPLPEDLDKETLSQIRFVNFFKMLRMIRLKLG